MRLTIFSRLFVGYAALFVLLTAGSVYAVLKLHRLEEIAHSMATASTTIEIDEKLTDALLSEIRYEKKFVFMGDDTLYDHFLMASGEFEQHHQEALAIADAPEAADLLAGIKLWHDRYRALFDREVTHLRAGEEYPAERLAEEKDQAVDEVTKGLRQLRLLSQQVAAGKVRELGEAGTAARKVAVAITAAAVVLGVVVSFVITRSITGPLTVLKRKTREIAQGNFDADVRLASPPEIRELGQAFDFMCGKLKEVDRMKSEFFSLMSHELRTPLTSIREGTNLLLEGAGGELNDRQGRILTIISEESDRLIGLTNSILDLSKMEAGMMSYAFSEGDIARLIQQAATEIEPLSESKHITLEHAVSQGLPHVRMDPDRMLQVVRNLLGNAVKFTPWGGRVRVTACTVNRGVEVAVADTGAGIPKEHLDVIFDKFKQASVKGPYSKGTGLGLAIAHHIVNAHGGRIWVESEVGQGSTFSFVLPV